MNGMQINHRFYELYAQLIKLAAQFRRCFFKRRFSKRARVRVQPIMGSEDLVPQTPGERRIVFNGRLIIIQPISERR